MDQHLACSWNPSQWCSCHNTVGADPALVALQFFRLLFGVLFPSHCSYNFTKKNMPCEENSPSSNWSSKSSDYFHESEQDFAYEDLTTKKRPPIALLGQWIFQVLHIGHWFLCADEMRHRQPCGDGIVGHRDHGVVVQRQTDRSLTQQDVPIVDDHLQTVPVGEVTTNAFYFWMFLIMSYGLFSDFHKTSFAHHSPHPKSRLILAWFMLLVT